MSIERLKARLGRLEERIGGSNVVLRFPNGSSRAMRLRDPLGCLLAAFRARSARIEGEACEENETLALIGLAESIEPNDALLLLLHDSARALARGEDALASVDV
jgi:hypothetical protein